MVVLDSNGVLSPQSSTGTQSRVLSNIPYHHHMQYVQPLQNEFDEKCDPLAMLTRACNKIETDLMKGHVGESKITSTSTSASRHQKLSSSESPRSSTASDRPDSSSPQGNKHATSTSPIDYKLRPPSNGGDQRTKTPKRPASSSSNSSANQPLAAKQFSPRTSSHGETAYSNTSSPHVTHPLSSPLGFPSSHGVCVDPMCRDPSCPTTAARNAHFLNFFAGARGMPPYFYPPVTSAMLGLTSPQSIHQAVPTSTTAPVQVTSSGAPTTTTTSSIGGSSPYVCNWMNGTDFCGRRFSTSDDLMSHLRSHTTTAAAATATAVPSRTPPPVPRTASPTIPSPADTLAALQAAQLQALYPGLGSQSALAALQARAVSAANSSLSPNSAVAQRYHPYMRPGGLGLPQPPQGLPPSFQFGHFPPMPFGAGSPFLPSPFGFPPFSYN